MKNFLKKFTNSFLGIFGLNIVKSSENVFDIDSCFYRIKNNNFKFVSLIDIGAADGAWTVNFNKHFPNRNLLLIEPLEERTELLKTKLSKLPNRVFLSSSLAGEYDNVFNVLNVTNDLDGSTVDGNSSSENRKIITRTIDSLVEESKFEGPFLVKFDTHGFELPILNGMKKTLDNTEVVIMECYNFNITKNAILFHEMCEIMSSLGFRCFDISNPVLRPFDNTFWQIDIFFCKKNNSIFEYNAYL